MSTDGDSSAVVDATTSFLEDRDDGDSALEAVLAADAEHESWTFDDVPLDSGTFGELVSRGIVEDVGDAYHVADPEAVEAVLADGCLESETLEKQPDDREFSLDHLWASVDSRELAALLGALLVVAAARLTAYRSVFQLGYVVSPGNDPYYFRYWMEDLLAKSSGPTDFGVLSASSGGLFGTRPFAHATNWFLAELLGGGQAAADTVAA
jgi:dolichyl-diphosphooligosaccharide--protein glycosyltransferase